MDALKQPEPLSFTGNVDQNWKSFVQRFELYLTAINADKKGDTQKIMLLLTCAGAQAIDVYNPLYAGENDKHEDIKTKLEGFCAPKKNETCERFVFRNTKQEKGEQFDSFLTKLKLRSKSFNYGKLRDGMIRDQIVYGILNQKTQERLLRETDHDLNRAVQVCQANEVSERQISAFSKFDVKVDSTEKYRGKRHKKNEEKRWGERRNVHHQCGKSHPFGQCHAFTHTCQICLNKGHFETQCLYNDDGDKGERRQRKQHRDDRDTKERRQRREYLPNKPRKRVETVQHDEHSDSSDNEYYYDDDGVYFGTVVTLQANEVTSKSEWMMTIKINNVKVNFKIDTGAQLNLLPIRYYNEMNKKTKTKKTKITLYAYNKRKIPSHGEISADLKYKKTEMKTKFLLVDDERQPIIGLETAEAVGFVGRVQAVEQDLKDTVLKKYPELFNSKKLGCLPQSHEIKLQESAIPTIDAQRKVPVAVRKDYKKTPDKMVELEVIKKIDEPTVWVSSPVLVRKKSDEICVCLDPRSYTLCQ